VWIRPVDSIPFIISWPEQLLHMVLGVRTPHASRLGANRRAQDPPTIQHGRTNW
jgi:hypothetical protein